MSVILMFIASLLLAWSQPIPQAAPPAQPQRFDMVVRADFFAGFAGSTERLTKAMAACEAALTEDPNNAEALVWHGAGVAFNAGAAFRKGEQEHGLALWQRGLQEMDAAVAMAPENIGVLIPRGAMLLQATMNMPPQRAQPLLEKAVGDYEHVLALQSAYFDTLGDHPKGELLFGLAEGFSRLGNIDKARMYFNRLIADAPASGQAPNARTWLTTGSLPRSQGIGCVGCHK